MDHHHAVCSPDGRQTCTRSGARALPVPELWSNALAHQGTPGPQLVPVRSCRPVRRLATKTVCVRAGGIPIVVRATREPATALLNRPLDRLGFRLTLP